MELNIVIEVDELLRFPSVAVLISAATPVTPGGAGSFVPSADLILDPVDRMAFKDRRPGIRRDLDRRPGTDLPTTDRNDRLRVRLARRRSAHRFEPTAVPAASLVTLLSGLRELGEHTAVARYSYPSAGGLYPVQTYLEVMDGRIDGLNSGMYYYQPEQHRLIGLGTGTVGAAAHAWINRDAYRTSAFSLHLVVDLDAIGPMYGNRARDYALIEAGAMCQMLMTVAVDAGLALCPVGELADGGALPAALRLSDHHEPLHTLLGGLPTTPEPGDRAAAEAAMLRRLEDLAAAGPVERPTP
jgi:nonribosomal peptide synthetase protein BlmIII